MSSYEILRRIALGHSGPNDGPSLGFTILLRQGMAAWLHAWTTCPPVAAPAGSTPPTSPPVTTIPSVVHGEMVQVWAQMVRRHQEVAWI